MLTSPDRRTASRREAQKVDEPLQRKKQRRQGDRRDAPRARREVTLIDCASGDRQDTEAWLSLDGLSYVSAEKLAGDGVEVLLKLPDLLQPLRLVSVVSRVARREGKWEIHVRFPELDVKQSLALARFLDERARMQAALSEQ